MTEENGTDWPLDRRSVLKASGAAAVGLAGFSGTVSARVPVEIRFCGCSQVCVKVGDPASYRILYATEAETGFTCSLDPAITEREPRTSGCYTADPGEKVIGVLDGQRTLYLNPNTCARRATDELGDPSDCAGCTANDGSDGDCIRTVLGVDDYSREGRHEYDANGVTIRTRLCKPPEQWENDPGGPPNDRGSSGKGR